ncbi:ParB N-terminal domain-containing protein [Arcobacter sp. LA11]|uniref:ParB/RepB/Spo0J family partition protein n=1 Tax=Arcobacter sp. LA11 TaxID=1898176 RepID=UPI0009335D3A|nr:ParB N-terminal domain-containing protein [Arcobacter sp. LA11]
MEIIYVPIMEIKYSQEKINGQNEKIIQELSHSIKEVGLINPITINKKYELLSGYNRLAACDRLDYECIECIVIDENNLREELIKIDENLVRKKLSPWEENNLILDKKEIYESLHPTATKAFKSKNNSLSKEKRVETIEPFSTHMAQSLNCTIKSITNKVSQVEPIHRKSPSLKNMLSRLDKKEQIKGIELSKISKLSANEMDNLSIIIEENLEKKEFKISEVLKEDKTNEKSMKEKLHNIFMYDLLEVSKKLSISKIQNEITVNVEEAKKFKNELNADFKSEIDFLIKNIK